MTILLPNEVWRHIFSYFEAVLHDDLRDLKPLKTLATLSLVCRGFRGLAQSLLYRTVLLWGLNNSFLGDPHERHVLLAAALANHPQLGLSTREISLAHGNLTIEDDLMDFLGEAISSLNMQPAFKEWLEYEITFGKKGCGVASFLLALMPNVRLVELCYHKEPSTILPWILGAWINSNEDEPTGRDGRPNTVANHLHNLEELRIVPGLGHRAIYITYFESVLLHPTIRTLKLSQFDWTRNRIKDMQWPHHPCNLRQLNLDECLVDASTVSHVLSRCRKLEIFTIEMCNPEKAGVDLRTHGPGLGHSHDGKWDVDLYEFGDALRELGQNLVRFDLGVFDYEQTFGVTAKVGSLRNLTRLRHLAIARNTLVGQEDDSAAIPLADVLPTSLETLEFKEDVPLMWDDDQSEHNRRMNDEVAGLVAGDQFPNLRELTMLRYGFPRTDRFEREMYRWDAEERGPYIDVTPDYAEYTHMELYMRRKD
ncbi:hypothetical protein ACHAPT_006053 [Fusarium lateritium]